ncbi:MAG: bifunctional 4-hydroxy-3-methylbut-2-enyl diphosphate reductase/30S ribosomal protein S1 [Clostridia bacterium]|nr:bifunctional 4-hydroxy-3-methylbut-2-enyl diphosphate reductase/30S ribosomal protein S1 [Clostridia bacterium]
MEHTITVADHAGFCFGVQRAVDTAYEELEKSAGTGEKLYCLGSLIHNKIVTSELESKGLVTIKDISEAPAGAHVLIRAHGEPDSTYAAAAAAGTRITDATCPFVDKIHKSARRAGGLGRRVFVIGDPDHPEVIGILGAAPLKVGAADSPEDCLRFKNQLLGQPITAVAQTTISREKFDSCCAVLKEICTDLEIEDTICNATKQRQDGAKKLAAESDAMVVIGDHGSSNSNKLFEICKKYCESVFFVENLSDLPLQELRKYNKIGVAASASAPQQIILEVISNMSEIFTNEMNAEMNEMLAYMDEIEKSLKLPGRGEVVTGSVVQVTKNYVVVNLGCKKDGMLPKEEITLEDDQELTAVFSEGDEIQAKVIKTDDGDGNILLSKKKLQSGENWDEINAALDSKEVVNVTVVKEVKGGVIAAYKEVSGFIPMSQLADHYVENAEEFIGKTLPVKVTRVDQRRNKAVFSHKAFLAEEKHKKIAEIWDTLSVGDVVEGKVMRFTDYGAFVDIGGIDGLLHISEISWGKLRHPQEALEIGQVINVKILSMNPEKGKISLGLKQNAPEPWSVIDETYHEGDIVKGKIAQIKEYGAFVELAPGLDGLVHISEVAHKRVNKISDELEIGQEIEAKILEIDKEKRRISLSIKATLPAPAAEEAAEEKTEE